MKHVNKSSKRHGVTQKETKKVAGSRSSSVLTKEQLNKSIPRCTSGVYGRDLLHVNSQLLRLATHLKLPLPFFAHVGDLEHRGGQDCDDERRGDHL